VQDRSDIRIYAVDFGEEVTSLFAKPGAGTAGCRAVTPSPVLDLIVLINAIINDVDQSAVAALFEVAAAFRSHPLSGLNLVVRFAFLSHMRDLFHVKNSAASSRSGKHLTRLGPSFAGSMIAVIDAPNFWLPYPS
jgi:hypothetical protein